MKSFLTLDHVTNHDRGTCMKLSIKKITYIANYFYLSTPPYVPMSYAQLD